MSGEKLYSDVNWVVALVSVVRSHGSLSRSRKELFEDDCVPHPDFFPYCAELLKGTAMTCEFGVLVAVIFRR